MFNNIYKNKKVLVTGHTGFKGSWLALWLSQLGADVVGYALDAPTNPSLFEQLRLSSIIKHVHGDVRDSDKLAKVMSDEKPEFVFHLAAQALVRLSYDEPKTTYETNVIGTLNMFEAVRKTPSVRVVVNVTSDKCYENREVLVGYKESDPMGGFDPYSSSKGCAELLTASYRNSFFNPAKFGTSHNVAIASARAGNVIGGGDWALDRLIPDCLRAVLKNEEIVIRSPNAIRPWQHVLEPLGGYLLLASKLSKEPLKYIGPWNFGPSDEDAKTVGWMVKTLCSKLNYGDRVVVTNAEQPHEANYLKLDCSKARDVLGWQPKFNAATALEKTVEWFDVYRKGGDIRKICESQIGQYYGV